MKTKLTDIRPRFGFCTDLDDDPEQVYEKNIPGLKSPVAVIPLPFMSPKIKKQVREFVKSLHPKS